MVKLAFGLSQVVPFSIELVLQSMHSTVILFRVDAYCGCWDTSSVPLFVVDLGVAKV